MSKFWIIILFTLFTVTMVGSCSRFGGANRGKSGSNYSYPDGPEGLRRLFTDLLDAAQHDERERVHDLWASMIISDAELVTLFGEKGRTLAPHYHVLMETLVNRGALELVAQVFDRKLDTVDIIPIDPTAKEASAADQRVGRALEQPLRWYAVRLRRAADSKGLRYDFFFYLPASGNQGGHWLTGNLIADKLAPDPTAFTK